MYKHLWGTIWAVLYKHLWGAIWAVMGILLLIVACVYAVVQIYQIKDATPILTLVLIVTILLILFVVEGAEIAAVGLLDKDPEQVSEDHARNALIRLQSDPEGFFTGRQLLVVASIVTLTFLSNSLASISQVYSSGRLLRAATSESARHAFVFAFPTFIVLWSAQLLPKFLAQENPLRMFSWPITQLFIRITVLLGRIEVGAPSQYVKALLKKRVGAMQTQSKLLPSRAAHYQSSAALRSGRGLDLADIQIVIGTSGEISVTCEYWYEAFGPGFDVVSGEHGWAAPIVPDSCTFTPLQMPKGCGVPTIQGPTFYTADFPALAGNPDGPKVEGGGVKWEIRFQNAIPIGEVLKYRLSYAAGPGACQSLAGSQDYYAYTVRNPTARFQLAVLPAEGAPFALTGGEWSVFMSGDPEIDGREAKRVTMEPYQRGYRFAVRCPLEGTRFTFKWVVGQPMLF